MFGFFRGLLWGALLIGAGWLGGSVYPAPAQVTAPIARHAPDLAARLGIDEISLDRLRSFMSEEQLTALRRDASAMAARAGEAIVIERDAEQLEQQLATMPEATEVISTPAPAASFEAALSLCPSMTVSNAPAADAQRQVRNYTPVRNVNGVALAVNPTHGSCLSSAFGPRGRGTHRGLDFYNRDGGWILAGAGGTVIERKYRDDFGNMLLIDHGGGVYTRYAHLSSFADGVVEGASVEAGQRLGLMGNTAAYQIPVHLHYELLLGDYANARGSFGLTARSPFDFPAAD